MSYNNFFGRIGRYFRDSYGLDRLSKYLLIVGIILYFSRYTSLAGLVIVVYATWRCISKNKSMRYKELAAFEELLSKSKQRLFRFTSSFQQSKEYKILKCPNCSQKLRVPRKKGRIVVTCKKCGTEFKTKS